MRYFKQKTIWTCGPAALRMVLYDFGIKKSEEQLIRMLDCTKRWGTKHKMFPRVAERYKLNYVVKRDADIDDLRNYKRRGYTIIVCYFHVKERIGHYAILHRIDDDDFYFVDPQFGPERRLNVTHFGRVWRCPSERGWFIGFKKPTR